jgi:hypothetical protein
MSREDLERFLTGDGRAAVARFISESLEESAEFDLDEVLDRNLYDAISDYDSRSGLRRWLSLRFTGQNIEGRLGVEAVEDVLNGFRRELEGAGAATVKTAGLLKLDLVGFSSGSAILHLAPADTADVDPGDNSDTGQQNITAGPDQIDVALGVVTELHSTAESAGDMLRFWGQDALLKGFSALVDALDRYELDMGITWRGSTGRRYSAQLTSEGRDYVRQYLERADTAEMVTVIGRVVELNISGSFDVKTGTSSNSPRYTIMTDGEDSLLNLGLKLGQNVRLRALKRTFRNQVGVTFGDRYEFVALIVDEGLI